MSSLGTNEKSDDEISEAYPQIHDGVEYKQSGQSLCYRLAQLKLRAWRIGR